MKLPVSTPAFRTIAAALAALALAACGEPIEPPSGPATVPALSHLDYDADANITVTRTILPLETSEAGEIDWMHPRNPAVAHHYVWLPARHLPQPRLFVFMPGANNRPLDYELISAEIARAGYHVIGLVYQNDVGVDALCKALADPECAGAARMEILTGEPVSKDVAVTVGNSIDHRLERVLIYLTKNYPTEHWHKFLVDGKPDWSKIAVGGQSQGAGQAALIARERSVPRVVMLSGPPDQAVYPTVDTWVRDSVTPASRMYALHHYKDHLKQGIATNLGPQGLGLTELGTVVVGEGETCTRGELGPPTSVFGDAHVLITDLVPQTGCIANAGQNPHRSTSRDDFTPLTADGKPALLDAWRYLIGDPAKHPALDEILNGGEE